MTDDLTDIQSFRAEAAALAARMQRWADARSSAAATHVGTAAVGLVDWCADDVWLAECAAIDAGSSEAARQVKADRAWHHARVL